jgi:hypothetical protein
MIASEPQRKCNERRIHSAQHIAYVLDAAPINNPGVAVAHSGHDDAIVPMESNSNQLDSGEIEMMNATDLPDDSALAPPMPEQLVEQEMPSQLHMDTTSNVAQSYYLPAPSAQSLGMGQMAPFAFSNSSLQSSSTLFSMSTGQS